MTVDFISHLIGAGQLALLFGIWTRLGKVEQRLDDHEKRDDERFSAIERLNHG
jgi:hypothetical protein